MCVALRPARSEYFVQRLASFCMCPINQKSDDALERATSEARFRRFAVLNAQFYYTRR